MPLTFAERAAVAALAKHLYTFLPASGNNSTSFPLAAQRAGIGEAWPPDKPSKGSGIVHMLTWSLENRRGAFCPLMTEIVSQAMTYRKGNNALQRVDIDKLSQLLLGVSFKIPEFHDPAFPGALAGGQPNDSSRRHKDMN